MTFVYADTIPVRRFAEEEASERAGCVGVSVLRNTRRIPKSQKYDDWDRRTVSKRGCRAAGCRSTSSKTQLGGSTYGAVTFAALIDRYVEEELPERFSTRISYLSMVNSHIRSKWADFPLDKVKPMAVEEWLRQLPLAPKSRANIRSLMYSVFKCAERWELIEMGKNPIALVRVKDCSKRLTTPRVLTVKEYCALLPHLKEPYRTMVIVAQCLGLRVSEIVALKWGDFDFQNLTLLVQRSIVHGRMGAVKTEYSRDTVPLDPQLVSVLQDWRQRAPFRGEADWLFANPRTGKPYHQQQIQKKHLKKAAIAAEKGPEIGWHTFRHTYRSWLDASGAPLKVQQELMRHASIMTTINVYGKAMPSIKREANSKVVSMALAKEKKGAD